MFAWQATVQDEFGNAVLLPVVTVYLEDGLTLASIYDEDGDPLPNPLTGTLEGFVQFWAESGTYKIVGSDGPAKTSEWSVFLDTPLQDAISIAEAAASSAAADAADAAISAADAADAVVDVNDVADNVTSSISSIEYMRKIVHELPFYTSTLRAALVTYSYTALYPQSLAVDSANGIIYVLHTPTGGVNSWSWITAWSLATGANLSTFRVQTSQWREALEFRAAGGGVSYLYLINGASPVRINVSSMPANNANAPIVDTYAISPGAMSQMCWADPYWLVQSNDTAGGPGGVNQKTNIDIWSQLFTTKYGTITVPIGAVGTYSATHINGFLKSQGMAFYNGDIVFGVGGDFRPEAGGDTANPVLPSKQQGTVYVSTDGSIRKIATTSPTYFVEQLVTPLGRTCNVIENEGVSTAVDGKLYTLWQTLTPTEWASALGNTKGLIVMHERVSDATAIDFSRRSQPPIRADDQRLQRQVAISTTQIADPITGTALTSFEAIINMMIGHNISKYEFYGFNQTLNDINGASVLISGSFVRFSLAGGAGCKIEIESATRSFSYWVFNISTIMAQLVAVPPHTCFGLNSPEGSVTAPPGSTYQRVNGGAGTSFYVKESGGGNTGWIAK